MKLDFKALRQQFKNVTATIPKPKKRKKNSAGEIIYSPAEALTPTARIIGIALRALILVLGTIGLSAFLFDAFAITYNEIYWRGFSVSIGYILLAAVITSATFGAAAYSRKLSYIAYPAGALLHLGIYAIMGGNPFSFIVNAITRVYNLSLYNMVSRGYMYFGNYMISDNYDYTNAAYVSGDVLRIGGVMIITSVICAVLGIAMMKKVRLWLLVPVSTVILAPVFVFNASKHTLGFVFTLVFFVACITVYVYDYRFGGGLQKHTEKLARRKAKRETRRLKRKEKLERKRELRAEADKMLIAALKADMGSKKSKLARKAVYKADKLARKNAKKAQKRAAKNEKKQLKLAAKNKKKELSAAKKAASNGDELAISRLKEANDTKLKLKADKKAEKDRKKEEKKEKLHKRSLVTAAGGFAGIGAVAIAIIAIGVPALLMKNPFPQIAPIYNRIHIANQYVSAYISGNDIDLNNLYAYGIDELMPRTLSFEPLEYEDEEIFRVKATGENNIYLKSWIGDSFDYYSDTWSGADYDKVLLYRQTFGNDFTPDQLSTYFKKQIYPSTNEVSEENVYKNFSKFGFTMQTVEVERLSGYSRLLFIPYLMDTDFNLLESGTLDANSKKFSNYYDGVYSSRFYEIGDEYSTISYVTRMNRSGISEAYENAMAYYRSSVYFAEKLADPEKDEDFILEDELYYYEKALQDAGIEYLGTSLGERISLMSEEELNEFMAMVELEKKYSDYVHNNYTISFGSERIKELADSITEANGFTVNTPVHNKVLAVVDQLDSMCSYTLTPNSELYLGAGSILEAFLYDVKEGYCSHFATAACAILREMGVPVRYAEGYIAAELESNRGSYRTTVLDRDAHAWIEIYYEGMGWIPYEVTPNYTEDMYDPDSATLIPETPEQNTPTQPTPNVDTPERDPNEDIEELPEEMTEVQKFLIIVGITAAVILVGFVIRFFVRRFIRRGTNMLAARYDLIKRAKDIEVYNNPKTDLHSMARRLDDQIIDIFAAIGASPENGELSSEYAKRLQANYTDLSHISPVTVFAIIQKEEFGHGLTFDEMSTIAEYLADITASVYAGLSWHQKIILRYIKRKI